MTTKDTNRYIDRPFNIRPICFWAFFVALTVVVCLASRDAPIWIAVYFIILIGAFVGMQFVKSSDKVLTFFGTSRLNFIVTIALCLMVASSFAITNLLYTNQRSFAGFHDITGVVENHRINEDGTGWFVLRNVRFGDERVSGRVWVFVSNPNETTQGSVTSTHRITFNTQLRRAAPSSFYINNGVRYTASVGMRDEVVRTGVDRSPRSIILRHSQRFFRSHMSGRNADLMRAMLFGDRSALDGELNENFSMTGLGHVLAVSGMHVGIVVGMLMLLLKLCRVSRKRQIPIIVIALILYCYICGFRFSVVRASIMFMVFIIRRAFLKSNDLLSSISLAAIIILLWQPHALLSVSFQFSFACMLGLALFMLPFTNFFEKYVKHKRLSQALAIDLSTTIMVIPLMISYFGFVSLIGLFMNVVFLPVLIIAFKVCVVAVFTWVAFPLLYIVNIALDMAIAMIWWMAQLPFAHIRVGGGGYWFLLYFVGLIFTSRFIFLRPRYKYSVATILILISSIFMLL